MSKEFSNKISFLEIKDAVEKERDDITVVEFGGVEIEVKNTVDVFRFAAMVDFAVSVCFDGETGEFLPEFKDYGIRSMILTGYTNIEMPESMSEQYELLYGSTLFDTVLGGIDCDQVDSFYNSVNTKLKHRASIDINGAQKKLDDMVDSIEKFEDSVGDLFGGIDADDIKGLVDAFLNGAFDENKLIEAVVKNNLKLGG